MNILEEINGGQNGIFKRFIDSFNKSPRIAWYPSAGNDFHSMSFFSQTFLTSEPASIVEPSIPDLLIFSDYYLFEEHDFLTEGNSYIDKYGNTIITEAVEQLPDVDLLLHPQIVDFPEGKHNLTNKVYFLKMLIKTPDYGEVGFSIVYVFSENESFCFEKLLKYDANISHIIHVRYGGGHGGGGKATGSWILKILKKIKCEIFITDGHLDQQSGDKFTESKYNITNETIPNLITIRTINEEKWSNHGDVTWNLIQ